MPIIIVIILLLCWFAYRAATKSASSVADSEPSQVRSISTPIKTDEVLKIISRYAQQSGYKIELFDPPTGKITLGESMTMMSFGFFFPISVSTDNSGQTIVEVGIKEKMKQRKKNELRPAVISSYDKCFNGIKAAIFAES